MTKLMRLWRSFGRDSALVRALAVFPVAALLAGGIPAAEAKYASIVIDAESGVVLQEVNADVTNYPASLTKMMTLYLLFEDLTDGGIRLDQTFAASAHAAAQAPSKLDLRPGESIAVKDAILAVVTKSANDVAVTIAENLAGSESAFAERMTQKARKLGMRNTLFHNASGLPDRQQHTTARDLSILARALYKDFPNYYRYFSTREFSYHGAVMANHNHLMNSFAGMDGIKTGYIAAVGFNLAASAVRNNHRLIGVVMGGESARGRDQRMALLLNQCFARTGTPTAPVAASPAAEPPAAIAETETAGSSARTVAMTPPRHAARIIATATAATAVHGESWGVQIGAYSRQAAAQKAAEAAAERVHGANARNIQVSASHNHVYRAALVNLNHREAVMACRALRRHHQSCTIIAPSGVAVASR